MKRGICILLCIGMTINLSAAENTASWITTNTLTNPRVLGCIALAGAGMYVLYKLAKNVIYQQEENVIFDHENEVEDIQLTKKDHALICSLIDAMEQDLAVFEVQPNNVKNLALEDFDDSEMAKGCEGMRSFFCSIYEQCVQDPENKAFLEEVVMTFKYTIAEKAIIA